MQISFSVDVEEFLNQRKKKIDTILFYVAINGFKLDLNAPLSCLRN